MKRIIIVFFSLLLILVAMFYLFQDKLIFRSVQLDKNYIFKFNQPFEEHFITTEDAEVINALWFKSEGKSKGLILYFHGNAHNLQRWGNYADDLTHLGYDVVMMDYRGYGKSSGQPTEQNLYKDAEMLYQWTRTKSNSAKIIIYGRSLGAPVATKLAASVQPELLILETPFDELKGATPSWVQPFLSIFPLRYKFPTKDYLVLVNGKKLIFHGTDDHVVPLSSALRLRPLLKEGDEFIIITKGNHRNLRSFREYQLKLIEVLK